MRNPQQQHHQQQQQQQQQEQQFKDDATSLLYQNLQNCNCCPYGYHIDLDFVRYCESLVGEKPSAGQLLRRDKRRSRKSIEIMLGLDTLCRFWEPTEKVHTVKEVQVEAEPDSPRVVEKIQNYSSSSFYSIYESLTTSTTHNNRNVTVASSSSSIKTVPITPPSIITTAPQITTTETTNNSPETSAFLRDALDDVVSDFERTLERASTRKNKISDDSNNLCNGNKINNPWEQYVDVFDSCVSGNNNNKSTTSTIKKDVQSIPIPPPPPPPPPIPSLPQQLLQPPHQSLQEKEDVESIGSNGSELDTQALQIIREQMAKSLNRMRELEEQVKKIPILQKQLNSLKEEKHQLEIQLKREETATKNLLNHVTTANNMTPPLKPVSPPFTPQKVSPIALESLGSHIRSSPPPKIIKHDVGVMCVQHKKDASTLIQPELPTLRSTGTNPLNTATIKDHLYTNQEVEDLIKASLREYDDRKRALRQRNAVTVGTQMAPTQPSLPPPPPPPPQMKHIYVQTTNVEKIIPKMSQSVMAIPMMKDAFVTVRPETRSIGCSDHKITDSLCDKCLVQKRTIGCGPDSEENKNYLSLKQMDMPPRSLSFSLGEHEKLNIKRKTIGTQYQRSVQNVAIQNTVTMETIGIQNSVINQTKASQYNVEGISRCTDTEDLILLIHKNTNTDEYKLQQTKPVIPPTPSSSPKVKCVDKCCNTDLIRTRDYGTMPSNVRLVNASSNTDKVVKKDACCGDIIKPHISIACADNYCDSCKDAIKNLARDFTSSKILSNGTTSKDSPVLGGGGGVSNNGQNGTKIPRPTTLTSPRTTRKLFIRQNTYTISTPSPSPVAEKKIIGASSETKRLSASLDSVNISPTQTTATTTTSSTSTSPSSSASQDPIYITKLTTTKKIPPAKSKEGDSLSRSYHEEITSTERKTVTTAPFVSLASISKQKDGKALTYDGHGKTSSSLSLSSSWIDQKSSCSLKSDDTATRTVGTGDGEGDGSGSSSKSFRLKQESQEQQKSQKVTSSQHLQNMLLNQLATSTLEPRTKKSPSKEMKAAMKVINDSLQKSTSKSNNLKSANGIVQKEWFQISSTDKANPMDVEDYLDCFEEFSNSLLRYIVNMTDSNGNTAMHYAVSHGNFDVVSILLDSKVCNVNQTNNAGYTCVMLVSLAKLKNSAHRTVVQRLFQMADVNIRAKKHCQTALMLAVSHGNLDMVEMLLNAGADINIQDEDGSTALMCAAEHGRIDIVKHLLSQQDCDSLIQDVDGSTAFKIAWQAGHRDIGLLLYVHEQMLRSKMPNVKSEQRSPATPRHQKAYQMHQQQLQHQHHHQQQQQQQQQKQK